MLSLPSPFNGHNLSKAFTTLSSLAIIWTSSAGAARADNEYSSAMELYKSQHYREALAAAEQCIKIQPGNASAHYLLALILIKNDAVASAVVHLNKAIKIDPDGPAGQYSRLELATLEGKPLPVSQSSAAPAVDNDLRRSVTAISNRANEEVQAMEQEKQQRIAKLRSDSEARIADMNAQAKAQIAANGRVRTRRGMVYYDPSDANDAINSDLENRITLERNSCDQQINAISADYANRINLVNEGALSTERQFVSPGNSAIKLIPKGTNFNVRNYETQDEPSGNAPTFLAPPAKRLQVK